MQNLNITVLQWTIPENICTIPRTAFRNSEVKGGGGGGVLRTGNPKAWGDTYEWNSEGMGGF